jgi:hypothetical protein
LRSYSPRQFPLHPYNPVRKASNDQNLNPGIINPRQPIPTARPRGAPQPDIAGALVAPEARMGIARLPSGVSPASYVVLLER